MDRRYKMVQYMVWAQLVLLAIVAAFVCLTGEDVVWRWDLPFWFLSAGLLLGLLAWPISRGTEKPMVLKWWLRIDFLFSLAVALPVWFLTGLVFSSRRLCATYGDYVLYRQGGFMAKPCLHLGKKEGLLIRDLKHSIDEFGFDTDIECFRVDTLKGCWYGLGGRPSPTEWVCPLDSIRYQRHANEVMNLIDSLWQAQPLLTDKSYGTFVFPDDFSTLRYTCEFVDYTDSTTFFIDYSSVDSVTVEYYDSVHKRLSFPRDSVGMHGPREIREFVNSKIRNGQGVKAGR